MLNIAQKYKEVNEEIEELNVPLKRKLLYGLIAFLMAALIISGPICVFINMLFIFPNTKLIFVGIIISAIIFFFLTDFFYLKLITNCDNKNIRYIYLIDVSVFFIFAWIIYLALLLMGVF